MDTEQYKDIEIKRDKHHRKHTIIIVICIVISIAIVTLSLLIHYKKIKLS